MSDTVEFKLDVLIAGMEVDAKRAIQLAVPGSPLARLAHEVLGHILEYRQGKPFHDPDDSVGGPDPGAGVLD